MSDEALAALLGETPLTLPEWLGAPSLRSLVEGFLCEFGLDESGADQILLAIAQRARSALVPTALDDKR